MASQFQWLTWLQGRQALASRLADPTNTFWTDQEKGLYLAEALRTYNSLCEVWNADFAFTATSASTWYNTSIIAGSPRLRTLTDTYLYTVMEYMLLEPATGSTWTGTSQFSISDLRYALQHRRDEMIQATACNLAQLPPLMTTPNTRRTYFPDSTLEPRRARFMPASGSPVTLTREDPLAWEAFEPSYLQTWKTPQAWSVIAGPPLAMDVDTAPSVAGRYDVISLQAGTQFSPPTPSLLSIPDDWSWVAKWGALADVLGRDSEATDRPRAEYCLKRYLDGLKIMAQSNWLLSATINGVAVDTPSLREMDGFSPEWQNNASAWPTVVTAGMDLAAACPTAIGNQILGISCVLVGNAPIPVLDNDFVQVSRDAFDAVLNYAQVLASFKMGGAEFAATKPLEDDFFLFAMETNKRLKKLGIFSDLLRQEGRKQDLSQPR